MDRALFIYNAMLLDESKSGSGCVLIIDDKIHSVFEGDFSDEKTARYLLDAVLGQENGSKCSKVELFNANALTLMPAFIDMHVHLRDPGQTQKEDLASGLMAACAGGYGTVVAMPNTNPVISSAEQARDVNARAKKIGLSNLLQSVSITKNFEGTDTGNIDFLDSKEFPLITEDGHDVENASIMLEGMEKAGKKGIIVSCHSEDCSFARKARPYRQRALELMRQYNIKAWGGFIPSNVPVDVENEINSQLTQANDILALAEDLATERNIELAKKACCHVHICHISTANSIEYVRRAKSELNVQKNKFLEQETKASFAEYSKQNKTDIPSSILNGFCITCEATPHHIALCGTDDKNIRTLVNPPLRSQKDRLAVIQGIKDGTIDVIATDHAPHTAEDKANGAPGFTGIEAAFAICNTELVKNAHISLNKLSQLMSANPARILHLNKGLLKSGYDADLTLVDPDECWTIDSASFYSKGKATPFDKSRVIGKVKGVFVAGKQIF